MKLKYILVAIAAILVYNVFLIQRDQKMFEAHDAAIERLKEPPSSSLLTPKEEFCQQQAKWHPDCNVE